MHLSHQLDHFKTQILFFFYNAHVNFICVSHKLCICKTRSICIAYPQNDVVVVLCKAI